MVEKEYLMFRELEHKGKTKKYAVVPKSNQEDIKKLLEDFKEDIKDFFKRAFNHNLNASEEKIIFEDFKKKIQELKKNAGT